MSASPHADFRAAQSRFVVEEFDDDGQRFVRITDPVTGLSRRMLADQRKLLRWLFRGAWEAQQTTG